MNWTDMINSISNKSELIEFINKLSIDSKSNTDWENTSVEDYLYGIASWIEDFSECPANDVDWSKVDYKLIARLLYVGKIYE